MKDLNQKEIIYLDSKYKLIIYNILFVILYLIVFYIIWSLIKFNLSSSIKNPLIINSIMLVVINPYTLYHFLNIFLKGRKHITLDLPNQKKQQIIMTKISTNFLSYTVRIEYIDYSIFPAINYKMSYFRFIKLCRKKMKYITNEDIQYILYMIGNKQFLENDNIPDYILRKARLQKLKDIK